MGSRIVSNLQFDSMILPTPRCEVGFEESFLLKLIFRTDATVKKGKSKFVVLENQLI